MAGGIVVGGVDLQLALLNVIFYLVIQRSIDTFTYILNIQELMGGKAPIPPAYLTR